MVFYMGDSSDKYMELFKRLPMAGLIVNTSGRPNFMYNNKFLSMVGFSDEQMSDIMEHDFGRVFHEKDILILRESLREAVGSKVIVKQELKLKNSEGQILYTVIEAEATERNDGEYFLCSLMDMTEQKEMQMNLQKEQRRLYTVLSCTKDVIYEYYINEDRMVFYDSVVQRAGQNSENHEITNFSQAVYAGMIVHPEDIVSIFPLLKGIKFEGIDLRMKLDQNPNSYRWVKIMGTFVDDENENAYMSIGVVRDIDEAKKKTLSLKHKAERDSLTGLYNHDALKAQVDAYFDEGGKEKSNALVVLDLDDFKYVNDSFGHRFGDKVLREVAQMLDETFGENDIIGRIGGDEYLVFCKDMLEMTAIQEKLEQLFRNFESHPIGSKEKYMVKASIGVAVSPQDGTSYKRLFDKADRSMYRVKRSGKNTYTFKDK